MSEDPYREIASFYRTINSHRPDFHMIGSELRERLPKGGSLLDIGCGSGDAMEHFSESFSCFGLDLSASMLSQTPATLAGKTVQATATAIPYRERFDVILMLFDTINHLSQRDDWLSVFEQIPSLLKDEGIFIFDANSPYKHRFFCETSPFVEFLGDDFLIMDSCEPQEGFVDITIDFFRSTAPSTFERARLTLSERTFPLEEIIEMLTPYFEKIELFDEGHQSIHEESENYYFLCSRARR